VRYSIGRRDVRNHGRAGGNLAVFWSESTLWQKNTREPLWQNVV
jgi:hypothetical protein